MVVLWCLIHTAWYSSVCCICPSLWPSWPQQHICLVWNNHCPASGVVLNHRDAQQAPWTILTTIHTPFFLFSHFIYCFWSLPFSVFSQSFPTPILSHLNNSPLIFFSLTVLVFPSCLSSFCSFDSLTRWYWSYSLSVLLLVLQSSAPQEVPSAPSNHFGNLAVSHMAPSKALVTARCPSWCCLQVLVAAALWPATCTR